MRARESNIPQGLSGIVAVEKAEPTGEVAQIPQYVANGIFSVDTIEPAQECHVEGLAMLQAPERIYEVLNAFASLVATEEDELACAFWEQCACAQWLRAWTRTIANREGSN